MKTKHYHAKLFGRELSNFACNTLPYGGIYLIGNWVNTLSDYFINDPDCPFKVIFFLMKKNISFPLEIFYFKRPSDKRRIEKNAHLYHYRRKGAWSSWRICKIIF